MEKDLLNLRQLTGKGPTSKPKATILPEENEMVAKPTGKGSFKFIPTGKAPSKSKPTGKGPTSKSKPTKLPKDGDDETEAQAF